MNIVQIIGGLGNQMFQYAFYEALKKRSLDIIKLDVLEFSNYNLHNGFELKSIFSLDENTYATENEVKKYKDIFPFFKYRKKINLLRKSHYIEKKEVSFNKSNLEKINTYFQGYWQNIKYFEDIENELRKQFKFNVNLCEKNENIVKEIEGLNSCSIHIRRGDYLSHPYYKGICEKEYYEKAIQKVLEKEQGINFFVFSNDIEWCKKNLNLINVIFVDWNNEQNSYIDMFLMSKCKHNIIANSTFSWWGAWLNENKNKTVIMPSKWMNNKMIMTEDLICEGWQKI